MSLLSSLPAPKRSGLKPKSRWDNDDEPAVTREMDQRAIIAQVSLSTCIFQLV